MTPQEVLKRSLELALSKSLVREPLCISPKKNKILKKIEARLCKYKNCAHCGKDLEEKSPDDWIACVDDEVKNDGR